MGDEVQVHSRVGPEAQRGQVGDHRVDRDVDPPPPPQLAQHRGQPRVRGDHGVGLLLRDPPQQAAAGEPVEQPVGQPAGGTEAGGQRVLDLEGPGHAALLGLALPQANYNGSGGFEMAYATLSAKPWLKSRWSMSTSNTPTA